MQPTVPPLEPVDEIEARLHSMLSELEHATLDLRETISVARGDEFKE